MGIEPTYPAWKAGVLPLNYTRMLTILRTKCPEPESNQRHKDFQSFALPTELSGPISFCYRSAQALYYHVFFPLSTSFFKKTRRNQMISPYLNYTNCSASASKACLLSSFNVDLIVTTVSHTSIAFMLSNAAFMNFAAVGAQLPFSISPTFLFW